MSDTNFKPYATKADLQELRGDLSGRIARVEGQLIILVRLNYFTAASLLAMAIKVIFFSGPGGL